MRVLLDTHALVWWWTDDRRLPAPARAAIEQPGATVLVSAASVWEIATKHRLGKWDGVAALLADFDMYLRRSRFVPLAITAEHARLAGGLAHAHRDPFDRMLAAQSLHDDAPLVSGDAIFAELGVATVWSERVAGAADI
jgi:PIN domain nuclease of toxin-antitoxin system